NSTHHDTGNNSAPTPNPKRTKPAENLAASVSPIKTPAARNQPRRPLMAYSQSAYAAAVPNRASPRSMLKSAANAARFGSVATSAHANSPAPRPHNRYAHQPMSATSVAPRAMFTRRADTSNSK